MRVTKIERQKRRGRYNVYADGAFLLGLSEDTLVRTGLRVGDELTRDSVVHLQHSEELAGAKRAALRLLATRLRTAKEIQDRLREKEFSDDDIRTVVEDLKRTNLLNDARFAETYIRDTLTLRPGGRLMLRRKLLLLGVEKELVDETLGTFFTEENQRQTASLLARKFLARSPAPRSRIDILKLRDRAARFLARRGYTWEIIQSVLAQLMADNNHDEGDT